MKWVWLPARAADDVESARRWYEAQLPGLGNEFVAALDEAFLTILDFPRGFPVVYRKTHRYLLGRFPYCIYYQTDQEGIRVVACLHVALQPATHHRRARG